MRNLKLTIEYDGTNYAGWQYQPRLPTIQGILRDALAKIEDVSPEDINLVGASRTDSGVHALGQVANFVSRRRLSPNNYRKAVNSLLPPDVVVKLVEEVDADFHARKSARGKKYRYVILNREYPSALQRNRVYYVPYRLNVEAMEEAIPHFIGRKDFASFQGSGSDVRNTVREITSFQFEREGDLLIFTVVGNGFLKQMVRNIIGTLVFVGMGKIHPDRLEDIFEARDRRRAGPTAPPQGLYLVEIFY